MKRAILFKTLIDILFFLTLIGSFGAMIPSGLFINNIDKLSLLRENKINLILLLIPLFSLISYIFFIRSLYFLRKMARGFLSNRYFSDTIISNLKKSGKSFLITGIFKFAISLVVILYKISTLYSTPEEKIDFTYYSNSYPFLLIIIGLFFIIQSEGLTKAEELEKENKLTI